MSFSDAEYLESLYEQWCRDPAELPDEWDRYFRSLENGAPATLAPPGTRSQPAASGHAAEEAAVAYKQSRVNALIWGYRDVGYIYADLNPLKRYSTPELEYMYYTMESNFETLRIEDFGLSEDDLDLEVTTGRYFEPKRAKLRDLLTMLEETYCSRIGVEFLHIQNKPMRRWLIEKLESPRAKRVWSSEQKTRLQKDLIKAEEFERFVQANFIGQKRFSLEGSESLIPGLHYLIYSAAQHDLQEIVLGMAHRGRLNVFTNALRKRGAETFAMFIENYQPHTYGGSGDVKYHLGHSFDWTNKAGDAIHISLVANPSHLESVDPVVEGKCRGIQRRRGDFNRKKVLPVLIHGDASFSGQGVVAETLNLSQLKGYRTGGTVHIIINNQIGFTTASRDARSTFFATDIAKSMPVPIFHVNGDDPEAVIRAVDLALRYRQKFGYDAVVDIFCYRLRGHNEADEPAFTHPLMYSMINEHERVAAQYGRKLHEEGVYSHDEQKAFLEQYRGVLQDELELAKSGWQPSLKDAYEHGEWDELDSKYSFDPVETGVELERLRHVTDALTTIPEDFGAHAKLKRLIKQRRKEFDGDSIDWAFAESLAFGSLLLEGYPIRLSGEDSARGTFSQRHARWWDTTTAKPTSYVPLRHLATDQASFSVYDSPLSEFAVLGFDYGYSLANPHILVLWEAQFGDFVNGAQVVIDNFIASGEVKWFRACGMVLLLPHGYEGQGPEHSSAHLERFLQLCAERNMIVTNCSTPAQYFHILRKQMHQGFRKPLVLMTPKSLLRHKRAVSSVKELIEGRFHPVIDDDAAYQDAERLLLCSGKVYYDLLERREETADRSTAIVRVEQLYPFHGDELARLVGTYRNVRSIAWVQEESANRGAWSFIEPRLREALERNEIEYVGRRPSASPATGSHQRHQQELEEILQQALPNAGEAAGAVTPAHSTDTTEDTQKRGTP